MEVILNVMFVIVAALLGLATIIISLRTPKRWFRFAVFYGLLSGLSIGIYLNGLPEGLLTGFFIGILWNLAIVPFGLLKKFKQDSHSNRPVIKTRDYRGPIPTLFLIGFLAWLVILILLLWAWITQVIYNNSPPTILTAGVVAIAFFVGGWIGIVVIIRKELPGLITIRGKLAIFNGVFMTSVSWYSSGYALYQMLVLLFEK